MISPPNYKVMGADGHEYGPVSAEEIRQWIMDGRLEKKSPVKPPDSKDWVFLSSLPEFAGAFHPAQQPFGRKRGKWRVAFWIVFGTGLVMLILKLILKQFNHL